MPQQRRTDVVLMLAHHPRSWPSIRSPLAQSLLFTGLIYNLTSLFQERRSQAGPQYPLLNKTKY